MSGRDLLLRLLARVKPDPSTECWIWTGAFSQSGWRGVFYPACRIPSGPRRVWRANRLMLMLHQGPRDYPQWEGEPFMEYLERLRVLYQQVESAHTCDDSRCVNPTHLRWKGHRANIQEQVARKQQAREERVA